MDFIKEIPSGIFIIISALIGAFFVVRNLRASSFRDAAIKFRSVILEELKIVYPTVTTWPEHPPTFLANKFISLQVAVIEFEAALPWYRRFGFRRAWRIYRVSDEPRSESSEQDYFQYLGATIDDHYIDPRKRLRQNIDRLLKYTRT